MAYVVEISDENDTTFRVALVIPWNLKTINDGSSSWRVLDEGFLRYRTGALLGDSEPWSPLAAYLVHAKHWGLIIDGLFDKYRLVNSAGAGVVAQPWCIILSRATLAGRLSPNEASPQTEPFYSA